MTGITRCPPALRKRRRPNHDRDHAGISIRPVDELDISDIAAIDEKISGDVPPGSVGAPDRLLPAARPRGLGRRRGRRQGRRLHARRGALRRVRARGADRLDRGPRGRSRYPGRAIGRKLAEAMLEHFRGRARTACARSSTRQPDRDIRASSSALALASTAFGPGRQAKLELPIVRQERAR